MIVVIMKKLPEMQTRLCPPATGNPLPAHLATVTMSWHAQTTPVAYIYMYIYTYLHIYWLLAIWLYGYMEFASAYLLSHGWGTCTVHSRRRGQLRAEIEHLRAQELTHFRFGHRGNPTLGCEQKCLVRIQIGFKVPFNVLITQITIDPLHYIIIST